MAPARATQPVLRLDFLTAVRFFAAIYVVLFHFSGHVIPFWDHIGSGYLGVDLFFVLSGFILMYNYGDKATPGAKFYRLFLSARVARIYPAYVLAFLLAIPAVILFNLARYPPVEAWTKMAVAGLATLSLMHAWFPRLASFWNFPSWSVSGEMFFYLCFPILAVWLKRCSERRSLLLALACILPAPALLAFVLASARLPFYNVPASTLEYIPILRLSQFVMGMAVGRIFLLRQHRPRLGVIWGILATALALCTAAFMRAIPSFPGMFLSTPVFAVLIYCLARCERPSMEKEGTFALGGLVLLGDASYSIYILQWPLFYLCGLSVTTMTAVKLVSYVVLLVGASVVSLKLVEQPMRRRILRGLAVSKALQITQASFAAVGDGFDLPVQVPAANSND
jgi:peptidoglycan/LPS O-acetylase OafA/YrhL